jgi:hypothetical protein
MREQSMLWLWLSMLCLRMSHVVCHVVSPVVCATHAHLVCAHELVVCEHVSRACCLLKELVARGALSHSQLAKGLVDPLSPLAFSLSLSFTPPPLPPLPPSLLPSLSLSLSLSLPLSLPPPLSLSRSLALAPSVFYKNIFWYVE